MDGFTVNRANRFLDAGRLQESSVSQDGISSTLAPDKANGTQKSFADTLSEAIGSVNTLQKTSDKAMQDLATGRTDNIAEVMIASEKADIALKLMVQVRNKIIDAYQDVMKMQV